MTSSDDDWLLDEDAISFLDSSDPLQAIQLARFDVAKKIKELTEKRDAVLAVAITANEGCTQHLPKAETDSIRSTVAQSTENWNNRRSRAVARLKQETSRKEMQLDTLMGLSKELQSDRARVFDRLRLQLKEREKLASATHKRYLNISKYATIMYWVHMILLLLVAASLVLR